MSLRVSEYTISLLLHIEEAGKQILYILYSEHLAKVKRMKKKFSKDLDLLYKDRSNTAQATENSFNKEPKRLIGGLDAPSVDCFPSTGHRIKEYQG